MKDPNTHYDPVQCLTDEVARFKATNTFNPLLVTGFYLHAACVLDELQRTKESLGMAERTARINREKLDCARAELRRLQDVVSADDADIITDILCETA